MLCIQSRTKKKYQVTDSRGIPTPRFETGISRIRNRSAKHYETIFDISTYQTYKICVHGSLAEPLSAGGAYPNSNLSKFLNYMEVYFHYFSLLSFDVYDTKS